MGYLLTFDIKISGSEINLRTYDSTTTSNRKNL